MATYTLISSNVLSSSAASVTFSSIPATFTDLVVRYTARSNVAGQTDSLALRINGLSTTIYSDTVLYANAGGGSILSSRGSNIAQIRAPRFGVNANGTTSDTFCSGEIYIPSYTASQNKPVSAISFTEDTLNGTEAYASVAAGLIRETGAITSIDLTLITGPDFVSGCSFYLYGISNA
jgi:hypothetical protein